MPHALKLINVFTLLALLLFAASVAAAEDVISQPLALDWKDRHLTIQTPHLPVKTISIYYLEAFCRPDSTNTDWWSHTIIPDDTKRLADGKDGSINLISDVSGVQVTHHITSTPDEVSFELVAKNPTDVESQAHWAQACIPVNKFAGRDTNNYITQCFVFIDNKLARLPTQPWATTAVLTPGQVYCPRDVPRTDVNPRPLSSLVPSNGLIGCYSSDDKWILATAWQPYQELFQGVAGCIHSDLRIGGLKPGETKKIRGKIYIVPADVDKLLARYEKDFPEQVEKKGSASR